MQTKRENKRKNKGRNAQFLLGFLHRALPSGVRCVLSFAAVAVLLLFVVAAAGAQTASPAEKSAPKPAPKNDSAPAGDAKNGEKLFTSYGCYECHGRQAQGSSATGPRLGPNVIPLALLLKYIRQPTGQMPPYTSKVVSDADLIDIYAFLQSVPEPPKLDSVSELK